MKIIKHIKYASVEVFIIFSYRQGNTRCFVYFVSDGQVTRVDLIALLLKHCGIRRVRVSLDPLRALLGDLLDRRLVLLGDELDELDVLEAALDLRTVLFQSVARVSGLADLLVLLLETQSILHHFYSLFLE